MPRRAAIVKPNQLRDYLAGQAETIGVVCPAKAKARSRELMECVKVDDSVEITSRSKSVAILKPIDDSMNSIDANSLQSLASGLPEPTNSAGDFIRSMRDGDRY